MNEVILQSQYYKFEPSTLAVMVMKHQPIRRDNAMQTGQQNAVKCRYERRKRLNAIIIRLLCVCVPIDFGLFQCV